MDIPKNVLARAQHNANLAGYPYVVFSVVPGRYTYAPALAKDMSGESRRMTEFDGRIVEPTEV